MFLTLKCVIIVKVSDISAIDLFNYAKENPFDSSGNTWSSKAGASGCSTSCDYPKRVIPDPKALPGSTLFGNIGCAIRKLKKQEQGDVMRY